MTSAAAVSASARPFVINGMALAIPPFPVPVPAPAPVRLNHSSTVKVALRNCEALPRVTYCDVPLSWTAPDVGAAASWTALFPLATTVATGTTNSDASNDAIVRTRMVRPPVEPATDNLGWEVPERLRTIEVDLSRGANE